MKENVRYAKMMGNEPHHQEYQYACERISHESTSIALLSPHSRSRSHVGRFHQVLDVFVGNSWGRVKYQSTGRTIDRCPNCRARRVEILIKVLPEIAEEAESDTVQINVILTVVTDINQV
jgi:hypothetical protein